MPDSISGKPSEIPLPICPGQGALCVAAEFPVRHSDCCSAVMDDTELRQAFQDLHRRFERTDLRFASIDKRLDDLTTEVRGTARFFAQIVDSVADLHHAMGELGGRMERLSERIDRMVANFVRGQTENADRFRDIERQLEEMRRLPP